MHACLLILLKDAALYCHKLVYWLPEPGKDEYCWSRRYNGTMQKNQGRDVHWDLQNDTYNSCRDWQQILHNLEWDKFWWREVRMDLNEWIVINVNEMILLRFTLNWIEDKYEMTTIGMTHESSNQKFHLHYLFLSCINLCFYDADISL